jgi:hypothetical protein
MGCCQRVGVADDRLLGMARTVSDEEILAIPVRAISV